MKRDSKGNTSKAGRHSRIYHWFYDTPAWQSLNAGARATYLMLLRRYVGPGTNNGAIPLSVREIADELQVGKSTAAEFLAQLQERGFITVTIRGTFTHKNRRATEWRLTEYPCDVTGEMQTKTFTRWTPGSNFTVRPGVPTVPVAGPDGTCGRTMDRQKAAYGT
ncbi:helix-turn-helix domain-containing protein [Methylobacterium sp. J-059]|uniref:helix-turn-helix domain-containing protein n=1 Tax=Methylobacterium sp. J-059 TaxID=2836643 RepID=UPI001FB9A9AC|nr:helix-turn-helix domain-containing protein [Methylobacterium sp. J-059]MCJ2039306.1 helix-turn-helix domain-containing protein [Methylobacterium sp. J-059]